MKGAFMHAVLVETSSKKVAISARKVATPTAHGSRRKPMEVIGGGKVIEYGPQEETSHPISTNEFWQESVVLFWWDMEQNVGGYHRIGHEPNFRDGPIISLWNNIFTPDYIYKDASTLPLREEDKLPNGFGGGDTCRFEYTDHAIWTISAPDVAAELHIHDCHVPVDVYPKSSDLSKDFAPNHMEVGSKVTGDVTVKGKHYKVNGLAFRDHGWGKRDWAGLVSHRWVAMSFGEKMTVLMQTFQSPSNELVKFGCVIRDNTVTYAKDIDVIVHLEADGLTHRGGWVETVLTTGEKLRFDLVPLQKGVVSWIHGIACTDIFCKVTCGDLVGLADLETTNNALRGSYRPYLAINAIEKNGLHAL